MKNDTTAYVYAAAAAILWGSTAAVIKLLGIRLTGIQILFYTSFIATVSLFVIVATQKKLKRLSCYKTKDYVRFAYMSFLGVFAYYVLLYTALQQVPGQQAFIVNYTWPIWVIIFAIFILKERFSIEKFLAILLGFIGVVMVVSEGNAHFLHKISWHGNGLALLAAVSYGLFSVLSKRNDEEKLTSTMFYYLFAFMYVCFYLLFFSSLHLPTLKETAGLLWLGIFTNGLAFVFWQLALKHGNTVRVSNIIFITPFLSLIYLAVLAGEHIVLSSALGAVLIVGGVFLSNVNLKNKINH